VTQTGFCRFSDDKTDFYSFPDDNSDFYNFPTVTSTTSLMTALTSTCTYSDGNTDFYRFPDDNTDFSRAPNIDLCSTLEVFTDFFRSARGHPPPGPVPIIPEILAGSLKTLLIVAEPLYGKGTSDFCRFARKQEVPGGSLKTSGSRQICEDIFDSFRFPEDTTENFISAEHMYTV
jgi:hypothetical protein